MKNKELYTTRLQAGLGLIEETKILLSIYELGMTGSQLYQSALASGLFPMISARRLRNIITECFSPRYLKTNSAQFLKVLSQTLPASVFNQLLLIYTALANQIFFDFITEVYWNHYSGGSDTIAIDDAKNFVINAISEGKTKKSWSETTISRVSSYLIGCCADFDLLSSSRSPVRSIKFIKLQDNTLLFFSYWLHFQSFGDNSIITHKIWRIFGLESNDVKEEL
ncbi:MAG: hypothetical protein RLZZ568_197, partial [Cyanobacteriota bacterium]